MDGSPWRAYITVQCITYHIQYGQAERNAIVLGLIKHKETVLYITIVSILYGPGNDDIQGNENEMLNV